jgi:hypothetical protein
MLPLMLTLLTAPAEAGKKNKPTLQDDVRAATAIAITPTTCSFDGTRLHVAGQDIFLGDTIGKPPTNFLNFFQRTWVTVGGLTQAGPSLPIENTYLVPSLHTDPAAWLVATCVGAARGQAGVSVTGLDLGLRVESNVEHVIVYAAVGEVTIPPYFQEGPTEPVIDRACEDGEGLWTCPSQPFDLRVVSRVDVGYMCVLAVQADAQQAGIRFGPLTAVSAGASLVAGQAAGLCPPALSERLLELRKPNQDELLLAAGEVVAAYGQERMAAEGWSTNQMPGVTLGQTLRAFSLPGRTSP